MKESVLFHLTRCLRNWYKAKGALLNSQARNDRHHWIEIVQLKASDLTPNNDRRTIALTHLI
jgi:hypothetical protein